MYVYINNQNISIESENCIEEYISEYPFLNYVYGYFCELTDEQVAKYKELDKDNIENYESLFEEYKNPYQKSYICKDFPNIVNYQFGLHPEIFQIGSTVEDYYAGKFIELSDEQLAFASKYPDANHMQIINMETPAVIEQPVYEENIEDIRFNKLNELYIYDKSENVNSFTVNGITAWFSVQERNNYAQSIQAAKVLNQDTLTFFIGNITLQVPTTTAEQLLASIQLYADAAFIVTKQHEIAISALETKEEIEAYDFTTGYPEKLVFNLG